MGAIEKAFAQQSEQKNNQSLGAAPAQKRSIPRHERLMLASDQGTHMAANSHLRDTGKNFFKMPYDDLEAEGMVEANGKRNQLSEEYRAIKRPILSACLLYTSPSPRDRTRSRMPSSA